MYAIVLLIVVLLGCLRALYYVKRRRYLELATQVPACKGCLPGIGHILHLGGQEEFWEKTKQVMKCAEDVGGVIALWTGPRAFFCVNDPDDALTVLNTCLEKSYVYKMASKYGGNGLLFADLPTWKNQRKFLNSTFSQHVLDGFMDVFNQQASLLTKDLEAKVGGGQFDPTEHITERMLEAICQTAVGISLNYRSVIDSNYKKALDSGFDIIGKRISTFYLHSDFIFSFTSLRRTLDSTGKTVNDMSKKVIQMRRAEREEGKIAKISSRRFIAFLDLLFDLAEDGSIPDQQIQDELNTIIAAGYDTTSRLLVVAMVLLGTHQEVQEKLYQEIMSVFGSSENLGKEDLAKLVYTEAVIKEVLRISPAVPMVVREIDRDVKLKNYTLPAGSDCAVAFWGIHRLPMWGPDRLEFKPERWLDPETLPQHPGAFCGFSLGKRNCIGKLYALMNAKTVLSHLVRKYRITGDYSKVKLKFEVLLKCDSGHHISLELRK